MISTDKISVPAIDSHMHFVNFVQKTDGMKKLLRAMDFANIEKTVLFGLPIIKKWNATEEDAPEYYLDDDSICYYYSRTDEIVAEAYLDLPKEKQKRIAPLLCGFNPTDKFSVEYVEDMLDKYPFWAGIGELFLRHDELTNLTHGEVARLNHPAMYPIYELAAKRKLPIMIHQNSSSVGNDNYKYLHELEKVLEMFPDTVFVWAHVGISRRIYGENYHRMIDDILEKHSNLYVDISWIAYERMLEDSFEPEPMTGFFSKVRKGFMKVFDYSDDVHVTATEDSWLGVIKKHINQVMLGSDLLGTFDGLRKTMARYNRLLSHLTPEEQQKIAFGNADRLWFSRKK